MRLSVNQSKLVLIYSKKSWNDTAIEISTGEEYLFEADGAWKDLVIRTDADGYSNLYMRLFNKLKRSRENKWFALIGSLDKSDNFLIGKTNRVLFKHSGKLCCFANDAPGFYWNNFGHITLKITRLK